jgi:two-component system cell cycle sensor histidine kinase/response regulator CckA
MEAIGHLAGGVAHDFNNILTVIYGYCNLIRMKMDEDASYLSDIDEVLAAAERAANLTRSLLAFSRKQVMNPAMVNLNEVVRNVCKLLTRVIGEDIQLNSVFEPNSPMIFADRGQIEQVLLNMATNARDAMPNGGIFSIETEIREIDDSYIHSHGYGKPGKYAFISVSDSGMGMDAATCKNIFDPFFTTKEIGKGTGLGLSIAYGVVKQHNGFIDVTSNPGKGTTFSIYIPLEKEVHAEIVAEKSPDYPASGNETVLIAEDDAAIRQYTGLILKKFGYDVILAHDGEDAIEKFRASRERISIVVMDMVMPGKSGKEACEEIRRIQPGTKVLFMSGYSPDLLQNKGFFASAEEILAKPIQPLEFVRKVRQLLDSCVQAP